MKYVPVDTDPFKITMNSGGVELYVCDRNQINGKLWMYIAGNQLINGKNLSFRSIKIDEAISIFTARDNEKVLHF